MSTSAVTPTTVDTSIITPSIPLIKTREGAITKVTGDGLTGPNWVTWQVRMMSLLALCEVEPYVRGEIQQPEKEEDPIGHGNWKKNDNYAKHLITQNVAVLKPYGSRDFRNAAEMRKSCGKISEKQKGRGFNLCVAPSPRNQVSRISDGAGKGLRIIKD